MLVGRSVEIDRAVPLAITPHSSDSLFLLFLSVSGCMRVRYHRDVGVFVSVGDNTRHVTHVIWNALLPLLL